ncbi:MAG: hypothetical protein Q9227_006443 [Pyrenula ochraceoflavens]
MTDPAGSSTLTRKISDQDDVEMRTIQPPDEDFADEQPLIHADSDGPEASSNKVSSGGTSWFIWALALSAGIGGLLFGYDTGVISSTLVSLKSDLSHRPVTTLEKSLITSSTSFFAFFASPIAGICADRFGRKIVILGADVLFVLGALWQAFSYTVTGMVFGRSIVGMAIGLASMCAPLYIGEIAPQDSRGRLVTVQNLLITGGQVVAYGIGWLFSTMSGGWRWMVGLGAVPAILQFWFLVFMPDTPRFLAMVGKDDEAQKVLRLVYTSNNKGTPNQGHRIANQVFAQIQDELRSESSLRPKETSTLNLLLFTPAHARALTIACLLQALQQLCGFNSIMYFSATIFELLHFSSPTLISLTVALTNFLFTIAAFHLIDRIGRRCILLLTIPIMIFSLLLCSVSFAFLDLPPLNAPSSPSSPSSSSSSSSSPSTTQHTSLAALLILTSLLLYTAPYATGLGTVPWQQSELFPLSVRSLGSSLATGTNWFCNVLVGFTFLPLLEGLGANWTFGIYALVCVGGWVAVWAVYPEMGGLGLEEITKVLERGWGLRR